MDHEDTITLNAFLAAASRLETPLPAQLQTQLNAIAQQFPASIYELHEFAAQYQPLQQQYEAALQTLPSEGERLKFATTPAPELDAPSDTLTVSWAEVERQLGTDFKDMALDVIERSHPDYEAQMAGVLTAALAEIEQAPRMTSTEFNDWLTQVFAESDEEL